MNASVDRFAEPGRLSWPVRALVRLPWGLKRRILSNPTAWRVYAALCRRLGWNENALGVHRASNGPFAGIAVRATHTNHLWAPMGGYEPDVSDWAARAFANPAWFGANRDIYDVGAYVGLMALFFARYADRVAAFEPSPANREALQKNLNLNLTLAGKIDVFPVAVSDRIGSVEMTSAGLQATNQLKTEGVRLWEDAEALPVTPTETKPLDALLDEAVNGRPWRPGFIKIDVEGAEALVLAGATETLRRFRPSLLIETHNEEACDAVFDALRGSDYAVFRFESGRLRSGGPWSGGYGHVAALPTERANAPGVMNP